jgi:hypothetical protein
MNQRKIRESIEVADMEKRRPRERGQKWGGTDGETRRILESENKKGGTMKKLSFVAMLLLGATILGATVFSEPIVRAAQAVEAKIVGPLDGQGNVKVVVRDPEVGHEPWHVILGRDDEYTVPAGKRLVIEYANSIAQLQAGQQPRWELDTFETGGGQGYFFLGQSLPGCTNCYVMSQALRLYVSPGGVITAATPTVGVFLRLSGYLVDL